MDVVLEDKICDLYDLFVEVHTCLECLNFFFCGNLFLNASHALL
jgi:hypothetical protein